jgi:hypothetical protein
MFIWIPCLSVKKEMDRGIYYLYLLLLSYRDPVNASLLDGECSLCALILLYWTMEICDLDL